jgi:hypothetical protein
MLNCPVGRFETAEPDVRAITSQINQATRPADKADLARSLLDETVRLLDCDSADAGNSNCRLCHEFSALRQQTAMMILKMAAAAARG